MNQQLVNATAPRTRHYGPPPSGPLSLQVVLGDHRGSFGQYLRRMRQNHGLSLRAAAEHFGVSFIYLQRLELGRGPRLVGMDWMKKIAAVYGRDLVEVTREAGLVAEVPPQSDDTPSIDEEFERLVTHPALAPYGLDARALAFYSLHQKQQWIEFARKLEQHVNSGGPTVDQVIGRSTS